jgi:hypothetical protein
LAEGFDGGGADGFFRIFDGFEEEVDDAVIAEGGEGIDGGLALVEGAVFEG